MSGTGKSLAVVVLIAVSMEARAAEPVVVRVGGEVPQGARADGRGVRQAAQADGPCQGGGRQGRGV